MSLLIAIYVNDFLLELRRLGVGCYIGGKFVGAVGYADDILLIAPCRSAMEQMLAVCEEFGYKNNLRFSTDTNPSKSKTKCLFMVGDKVKQPKYPAPLQLYGKDLPWVKHVTYLGPKLHKIVALTWISV